MTAGEAHPVPAAGLGTPTSARLATLVERYRLDTRQAEKLSALLDLLAGDDHAPTAVRDPLRAVDVHLGDSLAALGIEAVAAAGTACDLGAGAGFPGLPLAIALPGCRVSLVESATRKCRFLERTAATLEVENAQVVCARAEEWQLGLASQDVVFARALAAGAVVVEYAAPLLRLGGLLVDWRGERRASEEDQAHHASALLGLEPVEVRHVAPSTSAHRHHLHLYLKVRDTPRGYPRRAGMARKRPLGGSGWA